MQGSTIERATNGLAAMHPLDPVDAAITAAMEVTKKTVMLMVETSEIVPTGD